MFSSNLNSYAPKTNSFLIPYVRGNFSGGAVGHFQHHHHHHQTPGSALQSRLSTSYSSMMNGSTMNDSFSSTNANTSMTELLANGTHNADGLNETLGFSEMGYIEGDEEFLIDHSVVSLIYLSYMPICCLIGLTGNAMSITLIRFKYDWIKLKLRTWKLK